MIVLIGYMGSGKSTVGKELAKKLGIEFIDFDNYIEARENSGIPDIFKQKGEVYFRKKESFYLKELLDQNPDAVISLGGGTPCFGSNMELIVNATANVFFLKLSVDMLVSRLLPEKSYRPLIKDIEDKELTEFIGKHLFERNFYYLQSHHIIDAMDKSADTLASEIILKCSLS